MTLQSVTKQHILVILMMKTTSFISYETLTKTCGTLIFAHLQSVCNVRAILRRILMKKLCEDISMNFDACLCRCLVYVCIDQLGNKNKEKSGDGYNLDEVILDGKC